MGSILGYGNSLFGVKLWFSHPSVLGTASTWPDQGEFLTFRVSTLGAMQRSFVPYLEWLGRFLPTGSSDMSDGSSQMEVLEDRPVIQLHCGHSHAIDVIGFWAKSWWWCWWGPVWYVWYVQQIFSNIRLAEQWPEWPAHGAMSIPLWQMIHMHISMHISGTPSPPKWSTISGWSIVRVHL